MTDQSLRELLHKLDGIDDELPPEDFDPAQIVGDIREKVDSIKYKLDEWRAKADAIKKEWVTKLIAKADSLERKADRLEDYVYFQMVQNNFDTIPGTLIQVNLQNSPVGVEVELPASAETYLAHQEYMRQDTEYRWDKKALKAALESGKELPWAHLRQEKHIRFYPKKG